MRFCKNLFARGTSIVSVLSALTFAFVSPVASAGLIQYDNWSGNVTADYHVTIDDNTANFFTVHIQVNPGYQADVLAFGFDNGDRYQNEADLGFTAVSPNSSAYATDYPEFYFDTGSCGTGCNWNGVVSAFDTIIKLQSTGAANGIWEDVTFRITRLATDSLSLFGTVGLRSQSVGTDPCTSGACTGSDKAYAAASPPTSVPEPNALTLLLGSLLVFAFMRRRAAA